MINVLLFGSRRLNECYFIRQIISSNVSVLIGKGFWGHFTLFVSAEVIARGKEDGCEREAKVISLITLRNRSGVRGRGVICTP